MSLFLPPGAMTPGIVDWDQAQDVSDRITRGDPTLGWSGDDRMRLVRNFVRDRWEIWRVGDDGIDRCEMSKGGDRLDGPALIRLLVAHDTRHVDVVGDTIRANEKAREDALRGDEDAQSERADRLAHALSRDLDMAAPDGKIYPLQ